MKQVLVVEDDASIGQGLRQNLGFEGYEVVLERDAERGLDRFRRHPPDLVILDVMLPGMSGFEALKILRRENPKIPIMMVTARGEEVDRIMGLDLGADDYITKPFSIRELLARVRALLRRNAPAGAPERPFRFGAAAVDPEARILVRDGEEIPVTTRELDLILYLAANANRVLSRDRILTRVWGHDYFGTPRTVDNFITRIRQKIERDPENPSTIVTVRGLGYKFLCPEGLQETDPPVTKR